jgi:hypothetical protein
MKYEISAARMKHLLIISASLFFFVPKFASGQATGSGVHTSLDSVHVIRYSIALAAGPNLVFGTPEAEGSLSYFRYKNNFIYGARALVSGGWADLAVALGPEAGVSFGGSVVRASISAGLGVLMFNDRQVLLTSNQPNFGPTYAPGPSVTTFYLDMPLDFSLLIMAGKDLGLVLTSHLDLNVGNPLFGVGAGFVFYR